MEKYIKFWDTKISKITYHLFIEFLNSNGFGIYELEKNMKRIQYVMINENIISEIDLRYAKQFVLDWIKNILPILEEGFNVKDLLELVYRNSSTIFSSTILDTMQMVEPLLKYDEKDKGYYYFLNCYVEVTSNSICQLNYKGINGLIWDTQIINRNFEVLTKEECQASEFAVFLYNCMNRNLERYYSLLSIIGYLIHKHKDPSKAIAIIFCDEAISDKPNGGTGKSLTVNAIKKFTNTVVEDGKNFSFKSNFKFQQVTSSTELILFEDVVRDFEFEKLFSVISDGISVEQKYKSQIHIDYNDAPKILMTTNYMISGEGSSHERRKIEIEFSQHYNQINTPITEFGHRLFDDWNEKQYLQFDNFMLFCVKYYLQYGIVKPPKINIEKRKLLQQTSEDFVDFADELEMNQEFDKRDVFQRFISQYPDYANKLRQRTFTDWLKSYAAYKTVKFIPRKSNGQYFFTFFKLPDRV